MKPESGRWYWIKYSKPPSKRHYEGPALCIKYEATESRYQGRDLWSFALPDLPDRLRDNMFAQSLFAEKDIKRECEEPMTATKALAIVDEIVAGSKRFTEDLVKSMELKGDNDGK